MKYEEGWYRLPYFPKTTKTLTRLLVASADNFSAANSLDPDQARQNVGPELVSNCLALIIHVFLEEYFEKKKQQTTKQSFKIT